ncbi:nuclear transport factor 2 family protein [Streptomyces boluensis]|uniref:Nuclear transport factor 2 family protein n=1 Tax=Streptomyces boluensis TaxID=1775135 RepID=A0A964XN75_9ACTN|nr:nuclear transport factor 2 family protein [Streptomyces boluensis]NBE53497.1 nuclear transport factor 2 family protein [Streptomyces boluensis]
MDKDAVTKLVEAYISIWNESDDEVRQASVDELFTPDATYTDPTVVAEGAEAIGEYIAGARKNFTGMLFTFDQVLTHHDSVHFSWQVGPTGGAPVVSGFDVAWFEDGRINRVHGFFNGF